MGKKTVHRVAVSTSEILVEATCNKCGTSKRSERGYMPYDMHPFEVEGGYGDRYPCDLQVLKFVLCGACLRATTDEFVVPVEVSSCAPGNYETKDAAHFESGVAYKVEGYFCWKASDQEPQRLGFDDDMDVDAPSPGVYVDKWDRPVEVLGWTRDVTSKEIFVVYRTLYGEARTFLAPYMTWASVGISKLFDVG